MTMNKITIKQGLDSRKGISKFGELTIARKEVWTKAEILKLKEILYKDKLGKYISQAIWDNELDIKEIPNLIKYMNSKRAFMYEIEGKMYRIAIPSDREIVEGRLNDMNAKLMKMAITFYDWEDLLPVNKEDEKRKADLWDRFVHLKNMITQKISARLFSKKFEEKYKMFFEGITGVALPGNVKLDECMLPANYAKKLGIKIGDYVTIQRHPMQNIMATLKVVGFTYDNTVRINSLVFVWLGGDHDGDKVQFIPLKKLYEDNKDFFDVSEEEFLQDCMKLLPSNIIKEKDNNPLYKGIKVPTEDNSGFKAYTTIELLEKSEKSSKFINKVTETDYIDNQYSTVLNMRTVKEGTAFAGGFCNWLMEICKLHGELDERIARHICDLVQQKALDSKHNSATGQGYKAEVWYKITELRFNAKGLDRDAIKARLEKILDGEVVISDKGVNYDEILD
ncbi:MAG: hypothetical protein ACLT40_00500 [Fusobacterium sp.]